ncbi:hypothetical protein [Asticcacaulis machinosus]|uniref:Uncharacterized protein n=1 Tax=Asticcacaulis machinosus TaxID=2984211 RepID=A0ABT5HHV3_9CAUL|nr:hypothetical protein [Asticcacaulis machinosus]MDC7675825.1 hypothetical protein [Asticcacaulis machinosus]
MQTEPKTFEIKFYPRGPKNTEWKIWPTGGGVAAATGVAGSFTLAERDAKKALERLTAKGA